MSPAHTANNLDLAIAGLYALTPETDDTEQLLKRVSAAIAGGAALVQYRSKSWDHRRREQQARELLSLCRSSGIPLIINDDTDLAVALDADGVHLGRDDGDPARARLRLGAAKIIGVSCYNRLNLAQQAAAAGANYVAFGRFFPSTTKPNAVDAPIDLLENARRELPEGVSIVAIGGITTENGNVLLEAGAHALAVIENLFSASDIVAQAQSFKRLFLNHEKSKSAAV